MKIQYASDLHLELYNQDTYSNPEFFATLLVPQPNVDVLVLAGDIGYPHSTILKQFLLWCSQYWPHTLWVLGNHEYYNAPIPLFWHTCDIHPMEQVFAMAKFLERKIPRLHVLDNTPFSFPRFPDYVFLGTTLWTNLKDASYDAVFGYNDTKHIAIAKPGKLKPCTPITLPELTELHQTSVTWLTFMLQAVHAEKKRAIIITHHLPSYKMILERYQGEDMNCCFASNLDSLVTHPASLLWICGHSHGKQHIKLGKTTCVFNARGYPKEESIEQYNPGQTIVVEDLLQQPKETEKEEVEFE